ncbi:probable methyltransferase TARBP1 isoform X2 [Gigantopelta aegis]|uniref:probable methyltransferase TARBP1 isoform X2 n=1 Tax=Gigantopelta aegis TaxID=1735272 RepID=UPI001B888359|nr:probable methyltransferase TARBP1 isoform X2 [Gigantopelta aegis]
MAELIQLMCKISSFDPLSVIRHLTGEIVNDSETTCTDSIGKKINNINILSSILKSLHLASDNHTMDKIVSADILEIISGICFALLLELQPSYDGRENTLSSVAAICDLLMVCMEICQDDQVIVVLKKCDHFLDVWLAEQPCIPDQKHSKEQGIMDIICTVEIYKTVFSLERCRLNTSDIFEKCCTLFDSLFSKVLNILPHVPNKVISRIVFGVIANLLKQDPNQAVSRMSKLWNTVESFVVADRIDFIQQTLLILCSLADFLFPVTGEPLGIHLKCSNHFWMIVQQAMVHTNPLTRKRAMYLLKRIIDICEKQFADVSAGACPVFVWKKASEKEFSKTWEDVVLILETLEEKQVHVIKPLLGRMEFLLKATFLHSGDVLYYLHTSWLVTIFKRCLMHESVFVIKWAVETILNLDYDMVPLLTQGQHEFLSTSFLLAFQELKIYTRQQGVSRGSSPFVGPGLINFFSSCIRVIQEPMRQASFLKQVLNTIMSTSWSSVPVMFFTQGLSHIPQSSLLDKDAIFIIKDIVVSRLTTMEPHAKGIVQCFLVQTLINLIDQNQVSLEDFVDVISKFDKDLCLQRGTTQWKQTVDWLEKTSTTGWSRQSVQKTVLSMVQDCLQVKEDTEINMADQLKIGQISRLVLLAADAGILGNKSNPEDVTLDDLLNLLTAIINSVSSHAYMPKVKADKAVYLLAAISEEQGKVCDNPVDSSIQHAFFVCQKELYDYIASRVNSDYSEIRDLSLVSIYTEVIQIFHKYAMPGDAWSSRSLTDLCTRCIQTLKVVQSVAEKSLQHQMLQIAAISVLSTVCLLIDDDSDVKSWQSVAQCIFDYVISMKLDTSFTKEEAVTDDGNGDGKRNWGKVVSRFMTAQWQLVCFCLRRLPCSVPAECLFYKCLEAFDTGSWESDLPVMDCLAALLPQLLTCNVKPEQLTMAIDLAWVKTNEEHHTAGFWLKLRSFINMAFQNSLLHQPKDSIILQHLLKYARKLFSFGDDKTGVLNLLVEKLCDVWHSLDGIFIAEKLITLLTDACIFGEIYKKADNLFPDVWAYFVTLQDEVAVNEILPRLKRNGLVVRSMIVNFLIRLRPEDSKHTDLAMSLWKELVQRYQLLVDDTVYRQYNNSLSHRCKHRIFQILLLMEPFISEDNRVECWSFIWKSLVTEVHPSVRHMQEWLVLRLALRFPTFVDDLWIYFDEFSERRNLSLTSLITIVSHLGPHLPKSLQSSYYMKAIPTVIPWCMAHHFNTRLHAQVTIIKLWNQCIAVELDDVTSAFSIVKTFMCFNTENNNTMKNVKKLFENYFIKTFDFVRDYSLETIFYTLPVLAILTDEEWISPEMFTAHDLSGNTQMGYRLPLYNITSDLKCCHAGPWRIKPPAEKSEECDEDGEGDVQKKIMPWRLMTPDEESFDYEFKKKLHKPGGLVLVTSLIEKIPNLGGLCRTSEIFGVSEFVLRNLHYIDDKMFQVLSVTAQNWIPITEVPPERLIEFMDDKRKEGYTLIGAEQTANSMCLTKYRFPTKSLLLLGNEKEGIPVNLIQLLDVCVEIPQQGIIRSLNVHVSGALLIWEYARQQMEKQTHS